MRVNYKNLYRDKSRQLIVEEGKSRSAQLECDLKQRKINSLEDTARLRAVRHREQTAHLLDLLGLEKRQAANFLVDWAQGMRVNDAGGLCATLSISAQDASRK